ncbi:MAG: phytoene desaturase family protein [Ignavibacteria bacterium]
MGQKKKNTVLIIGSGFSGLAAACFFAKEGYNVTVLDKLSQPGGRARNFSANGFTFDMGPSWYWMNDIFERFFNQFGKTTSDFYRLIRLDPSYRIFWAPDYYTDIPANYAQLKQVFENLEPGSAKKLDKFLYEAEYKYTTAMQKFVFQPSLSIFEYIDWKLISVLFKIDLFHSISAHIRKYFHNPKIIQILEFPTMFLGSIPSRTPALYSLMNYADIKLGTWYPEGGIYSVVKAIYNLALSLGTNFYFNTEVLNLFIKDRKIMSVGTTSGDFEADTVIAAGDYHQIEQMLPKNLRNYTESYWNKRTLAPSALIYYLGINKKLDRFLHHTLLFDRSFEKHAKEIYVTPKFPDEPLIYISSPSKTDQNVAPKGCDNLFVLIPVASGLSDNIEIKELYFTKVIKRLETITKQDIKNNIIFRRDYSISEFKEDYNAFKGNAYGLANTLYQTAIFKPKIINKNLRNLYYTGQMTVPGPGIPPALISGEIVSKFAIKKIKAKKC